MSRISHVPRLFHRPPKYRLHKSTRQAVVSLNGKVIQLGPYGSAQSHQRYQQLIGEWQALRHQQLTPQPILSPDEQIVASITPESLRQKRKQGLRVSIYELIVVYQRYADEYYRKHGKVTREAELIKEVLAPLGKKHGRDPIDEFGPVGLDNFRDDLISDYDWSRKHINKQVMRIVAMFKWAARKEICSAAVQGQLLTLGGLKKGRSKARETPGVSSIADARIDKTLPHLPEMVADMVRFQRLTGARPGEVCSIRPVDIDRSDKVWIYRPYEHKTEHLDKCRSVMIGPQAQAILLPYLVRDSHSYCFSPAESIERTRRQREARRKTASTCGNRRGTHRVVDPQKRPANYYPVASYRRAITRACEKAGIDPWSPNQLRHTAATDIRRRFGLEAAQVICGHQTANVTQVYAERDMNLARKVASEIG
jgi:integrase